MLQIFFWQQGPYARTLEGSLYFNFLILEYFETFLGVWVDDKKICALGIHASRYITTHGLALNCNTDLTWFSHIIPCGIVGKTVTSLSQQLGRNTDIHDVLPRFEKSFSKLFECDVEKYSLAEAKEFLNKLTVK